MGEIETYNNLTLDEKHQYWVTYLTNLITFISTDKPVKSKAKILEEIQRVQKIVDIFQGSTIPKIDIESAINTPDYKRIVKKAMPKPKEPEIKLPKAKKYGNKMVFKYRYDARLGGFTALKDEDRSEEA